MKIKYFLREEGKSIQVEEDLDVSARVCEHHLKMFHGDDFSAADVQRCQWIFELLLIHGDFIQDFDNGRHFGRDVGKQGPSSFIWKRSEFFDEMLGARKMIILCKDADDYNYPPPGCHESSDSNLINMIKNEEYYAKFENFWGKLQDWSV